MKKDNTNKQAKKLPGFYIALCCCVLAIGIAGYVNDKLASDKKQITDEETFSSVADIADLENANNFSTPNNYIASLPTVFPTEEAVITEDYSVPTSSDTEVVEEYALDNPDVQSAAVIVSDDKPYFSMPAGGTIISSFTTSLSYNEATSDYRTHNGIDISADEGCSISAVADGTVEDINADVMGQNITLSHSNGMTSKYMGLASTENLTIGDKVKSGDVIGLLGAPKGENTSEPHLHFEMYRDGIAVNPETYLK